MFGRLSGYLLTLTRFCVLPESVWRHDYFIRILITCLPFRIRKQWLQVLRPGNPPDMSRLARVFFCFALQPTYADFNHLPQETNRKSIAGGHVPRFPAPCPPALHLSRHHFIRILITCQVFRMEKDNRARPRPHVHARSLRGF